MVDQAIISSTLVRDLLAARARVDQVPLPPAGTGASGVQRRKLRSRQQGLLKGDVYDCQRRLEACHQLGRRLEARFRQQELEAEAAEAAAAEVVADEAAQDEDEVESEGQLSNLLGRHAVIPESDPVIQFGSGAPAVEDIPLISFGTVDLGAMRPVRMGPDPGVSLGRDEVDDHGGEAALVRQTPRPDRLLEALKVASIVESVGRVPTGSGTPASGTCAPSDTAPAPVQSSHPGGDKAQVKRAKQAQVKSAKQSAKPGPIQSVAGGRSPGLSSGKSPSGPTRGRKKA